MCDLSIRITGAVKAELARRDLEGYDLAEPLGIGRNAVYARLRGDTPFNTDEIAVISEFLGITVETLFASAELGLVAA